MRASVFIGLIGGLLLPSLAQAASLLLGDASSGKALHDKYCVSCHAANFGEDGSRIYTRNNRRVQTVEGLSGQVSACAANLGFKLRRDELQDIVKYLNDEYYRFD
jgi:mono/diheme cytochrome c family protein